MPSIDARIRDIALIKAVLATAVLVIMFLTFRYPVPLLVAGIDLLLVPVYVWAAKRWPIPATYLLVAQTALALTPRQFVQGYVNGINWVFYLPLPLAAVYVLSYPRALINATIIVSTIAAPITLAAALTLEPRISRADVLTLIAYLIIVLWGVTWLGYRLVTAHEHKHN
jgi:hypothetical protein